MNQFTEPCPRCQGRKSLPNPADFGADEPCPACKGKGAVPNKMGADLLEFLDEYRFVS
jgi:hypothetical protein